MKIPCDRASFEAQTVGDKSCIVECEGVRYDCVLQEIIDEKGVGFVRKFIGDEVCEATDWDSAVERCYSTIAGVGWAFDFSNEKELLEVTINLPFYAKINASFTPSDINQLNEFCKFLEGKK